MGIGTGVIEANVVVGMGSKKADKTPTPFNTFQTMNTFRSMNNLILLLEEFWILKSTTNWIFDGDRNTRFYHLPPLTHQHRNRITALKDTDDQTDV